MSAVTDTALLSPLLRAERVAALLSVDRRTVYRWAEQGVLPSVRLSAKVLRFRREDVATFVSGRESK